jgi:hypothetical protein
VRHQWQELHRDDVAVARRGARDRADRPPELGSALSPRDRVEYVARRLERLNVTFSSAISDELETRVTEARGEGIAPDDLVDHVRDGLPYRVVSRIALEAVRAEVEGSEG